MKYEKPLVSYCIFAYNQEKFIKNAIEGALSQTYSPLEIIISDDCSNDSTFSIIQETIQKYKGPHKIIINQNDKNIGIGGHISKICYTIAQGEYIILLGGDDISMKEHVSEAVKQMEIHKNVNMIDLSGKIINKEGNIIRKIDLKFNYKKYTLNDYILMKKIQSFAPGRILRRQLIQAFDPISNNCPTEDTVFVLRSLLTGGLIRVNLPVIHYRIHDSNTSNMKGLQKLSNQAIIAQYFKDLIKIYDAGKISDYIFEAMINRINYEIKLRKLKYSANNNIYSKIYRKAAIHFLRYLYFINHRSEKKQKNNVNIWLNPLLLGLN